MSKNSYALIYRRVPLSRGGFTLVEVMIGMAIGLLATLVILQVFSLFESQKRATTGTADAQTNGAIALYNLGRELQIAGYPLMPVENSPLECTALTIGPAGITGIFPVFITDGVSDTITFRYGSSRMGGVPTAITAMGAPTANDATVANNLGCQTNDIAILTTGTACTLTSVTAVPGTTTVSLASPVNAIVGANLACVGNWSEITYQVNAGNLERVIGGAAVPVVVGIVNLQAQYGISATANSNQVTQWVDATGATWAAPTVANRNRIKALRVAVVSRNAKIEQAAVTAACSSVTLASPTGLCAWEGSVASPAPAISLVADADWTRYRYRVFESIIPLRNMIWSRDTL